jgi:hypothetical protein
MGTETLAFHVIYCLSSKALAELMCSNPGIPYVASHFQEASALVCDRLQEGRAPRARATQHKNHFAGSNGAIERVQDGLGRARILFEQGFGNTER